MRRKLPLRARAFLRHDQETVLEGFDLFIGKLVHNHKRERALSNTSYLDFLVVLAKSASDKPINLGVVT